MEDSSWTDSPAVAVESEMLGRRLEAVTDGGPLLCMAIKVWWVDGCSLALGDDEKN